MFASLMQKCIQKHICMHQVQWYVKKVCFTEGLFYSELTKLNKQRLAGRTTHIVSNLLGKQATPDNRPHIETLRTTFKGLHFK